MENKIREIKMLAENEIKNVTSLEELNNYRLKFAGKQGMLTEVMRGMRDVAPENRAAVGALVNEVRTFVESEIKRLEERFNEENLNKKLASEKIDITEPSKNGEFGAIHPLYKTFNKLIDACVELGFEVVTGPEVEIDKYNFEKLNVPKDHPARDMQDTFYLGEDILLRSQTSCVQVRVMENKKPPIKIVSPGRTYRVDNDATHSPVFHQFEGLVIDKNVTMLDLKMMLNKLIKILFGEETETRFRPSFFPFTEPSVEVDVTCPYCGGKGCNLCKHTGFIELLGAGIVNPKVLEGCGIDPEEYSGFAFGQGVDRLCMVMNKIPDLRMFFESDMRFLDQVK